jgi:tRNA(Ile2) C34 agmatinyltransferase TiaS
MAAYEAHMDKMVGDEQALSRAKTVADFDAPETECPACGTRFATQGAERCPDCGIKFG